MGLEKFFKKIEKQTRTNLKHLPKIAFNLGTVTAASCAQGLGHQLGVNLASKKESEKLGGANINSNNTTNFFGDSAVAGALKEFTSRTEQQQSK